MQATYETDLVVTVIEKSRTAPSATAATDPTALLPQQLAARGARLDMTTPDTGETVWTWTVPMAVARRGDD